MVPNQHPLSHGEAFPSSKSWAPLRPGCCGPSRTAGCSAFPSSKSWAPLRLRGQIHNVRELHHLFPALKAGLHCDAWVESLTRPRDATAFPSSKSWAPLRRRSPQEPQHDEGLFPALKAGLHCDLRKARRQRSYTPAFPSSKSWAPLRRGVPALRVGRRPAFPSSKSWAPLRLILHLVPTSSPHLLFPALKAGLHCDGHPPQQYLGGSPQLFPALKAGLHCDRMRPGIYHYRPQLFPALKAGLHCD